MIFGNVVDNDIRKNLRPGAHRKMGAKGLKTAPSIKNHYFLICLLIWASDTSFERYWRVESRNVQCITVWCRYRRHMGQKVVVLGIYQIVLSNTSNKIMKSVE